MEKTDHGSELTSVQGITDEHHPLSSKCLEHQCGIEAARDRNTLEEVEERTPNLADY